MGRIVFMKSLICLLALIHCSLFSAPQLEEFITPERANFDVHGSSILEAEPGVLLATWNGGPGSGKTNTDMKKNVGVYVARCEKGVWSEPKLVVPAPETRCWNPILTRLPSGEILLFYRTGLDPRRFVGMLIRSTDGGLDWSAPEVLPAGIYGPTRTKPIVTKEGMLICGSSMESGEPTAEYKATSCWIEMSEDGGRNWKKYGPIEIPGERFGALEPALFYDLNGNLRMVCRDRAHKVGREGFIWTATSLDGGKNWTPLQKTSLPNPDAAIDVVSLDKGRILLCYNDSQTNRYPLSLALSEDGGEKWQKICDIEKHSGEFPAMILTSDGLVHITYAIEEGKSGQRRIKHIALDPKKLNDALFEKSS
jgi:predicted neuraminidase